LNDAAMTDQEIVGLATRVAHELGREWQREPRYFERESDLVAELGARLRTVLRFLGRDWVSDPGGLNAEPGGPCRYGAVTINTCLLGADGKSNVYPDIVIWAAAPLARDFRRDGWPVLWACEVKYTFADCGHDDFSKLAALVSAGRVGAACYLQFVAQTVESLEQHDPAERVVHLRFSSASR
jgi:hypothetical protein